MPVPKEQVWAALSLSHFTHNNHFKCLPVNFVLVFLRFSICQMVATTVTSVRRFEFPQQKHTCIMNICGGIQLCPIWCSLCLFSPYGKMGEGRNMFNLSLIISSNTIRYVCFEFYYYVTSFFQTVCSSFSSLLPFYPYLQHLKNKIFIHASFVSAVYKRQWFKCSRNLHIYFLLLLLSGKKK